MPLGFHGQAETLRACRVRPSAALWGPIARICPDVPPARDFLWNFVDWICGCVMIYSSLFGIGKIILDPTKI